MWVAYHEPFEWLIVGTMKEEIHKITSPKNLRQFSQTTMRKYRLGKTGFEIVPKCS